ncbi:MAG: hypothetical protein WC670_04330 [Pseudolabrys sp.]|jgi:hypothetical protein
MPLVPLFHRIGRLRVTPDDPEAIVGARPQGPQGQPSRRPHTDERVAMVRRLIEQTTLTYGQIAARTQVGRASICRWTRDFGWVRPAFAPRATDRIPRPRAGQKLKLRLLAERLRALAERRVRELEEAAAIDPDKLMQALQVLKMARLEAMGRRRRRKSSDAPARTGRQWMSEQDAIRTAIKEMHRGGVTVDLAPDEAVEMVIDAKRPPEDHPALRPRGRRR